MGLGELVRYALSGLAGSALAAAVFQWWVKSTLDRLQKKRDAELAHRRDRYALEDEYRHAVGRVLFWLHHGVKSYEKAEAKGYWNGELARAIETLESVEARKKELDREQLAEANEVN